MSFKGSEDPDELERKELMESESCSDRSSAFVFPPSANPLAARATTASIESFIFVVFRRENGGGRNTGAEKSMFENSKD